MELINDITDALYIHIMNDSENYSKYQNLIKNRIGPGIKAELIRLKQSLLRYGDNYEEWIHILSGQQGVHYYQLIYCLAESWELLEELDPNVKDWVLKTYNDNGTKKSGSKKIVKKSNNPSGRDITQALFSFFNDGYHDDALNLKLLFTEGELNLTQKLTVLVSICKKVRKSQCMFDEYTGIPDFDRLLYMLACSWGMVGLLPPLFVSAMNGEEIPKNETKESKQPEKTMNFKTTVTHTVNGTDVSTMSVSDLIETIAKAEEKVASLQKIKTKSKMIDLEIKNLKSFISDVVSQLDARVPETTEE